MDFAEDRDLIHSACNLPSLGPPAMHRGRMRAHRRCQLYHWQRGVAWEKLKDDYQKRHEARVSAERPRKLGIALPMWMVWIQIFLALWPVFLKVWNSYHGDESLLPLEDDEPGPWGLTGE